jgi:hypothetical protein
MQKPRPEKASSRNRSWPTKVAARDASGGCAEQLPPFIYLRALPFRCAGALNVASGCGLGWDFGSGFRPDHPRVRARLAVAAQPHCLDEPLGRLMLGSTTISVGPPIIRRCSTLSRRIRIRCRRPSHLLECQVRHDAPFLRKSLEQAARRKSALSDPPNDVSQWFAYAEIFGR